MPKEGCKHSGFQKMGDNNLKPLRAKTAISPWRTSPLPHIHSKKMVQKFNEQSIPLTMAPIHPLGCNAIEPTSQAFELFNQIAYPCFTEFYSL